VTAPPLDDEAARLEGLGYTSEFKREMSLAANFSLGFTHLSPVVATYTLFAVALALGGPPMIWWLVFVGVGIGIGAVYMVLAKPYLRSDARYGDAVPTPEGVKE
jgi:hypothetical protein